MDSETFNEYLEKRYYGQLAYYKSASGKNQKRYKNFQWILIILSALTPVLAALNGEKFPFQIPLILISALVAILTTGMKTFQYQELWASYRATSEQLKPEIHYYNFNVGPYGMPGTDKQSVFISRVEAILDKEHQGWPPAKKIREDRNQGEKENPGITMNNTVDPSVKVRDE